MTYPSHLCFRGARAEHCIHGMASPRPSWRALPEGQFPSSGSASVGLPNGEEQESTSKWHHFASQTQGTALNTEVKHARLTHHTHTHTNAPTVIYCSNKSLRPPNFLWISISPRAYLHWSTSGVRMCQASLTVTLKNDSQISAIRLNMCVCVCVSVNGYNRGICAHAAFLLSSVVTGEALGDKPLSLLQ